MGRSATNATTLTVFVDKNRIKQRQEWIVVIAPVLLLSWLIGADWQVVDFEGLVVLG